MNRQLRRDTASFDLIAVAKEKRKERSLYGPPIYKYQNAARDGATHWDAAIQRCKSADEREQRGWIRAKTTANGRALPGTLLFSKTSDSLSFFDSINISQPPVTECCHNVESIQEVLQVPYSVECGGFNN